MINRFFVALVLIFGFCAQAQAWDLWDSLKSTNLEDGRIVDYSDERHITTSEGQSYALFFALVAGDKESFSKILKWTEDNLSAGDFSKTLPAWLWGAATQQNDPGKKWRVIDSNNAVDSDMWIAYSLLEAGRLWDRPDYTEKGKGLLELLKTQVRTIPNLGQVLLPGRLGFENQGEITLNPSYYPLFILRRFCLEDPSWQAVFDGSLRAIVRSAPGGFSPDWVTFDKSGNIVEGKPANAVGSYNAIRVYLWAGMMSPKDPAYSLLKEHFAPMVKATTVMNIPPEKIDVNSLKINGPGPDAFGACLLGLLGKDKSAAFIRTLLTTTPLKKENYYRNVLTLFGLGFDSRIFLFDLDGKVYFSPDDMTVISK